MKTKRHMSVNIEGMLRNYKGKKINFVDDDNGNRMTDKEARAEIAKLQALGHKLMPTATCEGFDPFGKGSSNGRLGRQNTKKNEKGIH